MSVSLKFTFDNIEAAQAFLAGKIAGTPTAPVAVAAAPAAAPTPAPAAEQKPEKKKGAAKNATPPAPEPAPAPTPTPATEPTALTPEHVRAALLKVSDKFGADGFSKVAEVLAPFGIQKVKDIKPEQYAEVVAAAEKLAA